MGDSAPGTSKVRVMLFLRISSFSNPRRLVDMNTTPSGNSTEAFTVFDKFHGFDGSLWKYSTSSVSRL